MLSLRKRSEVKALLADNYRTLMVARLAGLSSSSVKRIAKEPAVTHFDDAAERKRRRIGRPSTALSVRGQVAQILHTDPGIKSVEIFRRLRQQGYSGPKSAVYALIASLRAEREQLAS